MTDITPEELRNMPLFGGIESFRRACNRAADTIERQAARIAELEKILEESDDAATRIASGIGVPLHKENYEILRGSYTLSDVLGAVAIQAKASVAELEQQIAELRANHSP